MKYIYVTSAGLKEEKVIRNAGQLQVAFQLGKLSEILYKMLIVCFGYSSGMTMPNSSL